MKTDTNLTQNQAESGNLVKPVLANRLFNTKKDDTRRRNSKRNCN
jgi:hypothetical protein